MIVWLALLVPLGTIVALRVWFRRWMTWWEYTLPLAASLITIGIGKLCADSLTVMDTEYWGGWVQEARYYEPWNERVSCRHPKYRTEYYECGDGKTSRTCTRQVQDGYEHFYDVDEHPPMWEVEDSNGFEIRIDSGEFERLCATFGKREFVDMHRDYHTQDGDSYVTAWPGKWETMQPTATVHRYSNRVAISKSIYSYPEVDPKKSPVYEYPEVEGYKCDSVLSKRAWPNEEEIEKVNAALGAKKQVRVWVLVWDNAPRQVGLDQEAFWKGSNKNELVICLSQNKGEIQWAHVFSWTKSESLKTAVKSYLAVDNPKLDFATFAPWLKSEIESKWQRRDWKEFDYLTVEPPTWAVILIWVVTIGACLGVGYFCVSNDYEGTEA